MGPYSHFVRRRYLTLGNPARSSFDKLDILIVHVVLITVAPLGGVKISVVGLKSGLRLQQIGLKLNIKLGQVLYEYPLLQLIQSCIRNCLFKLGVLLPTQKPITEFSLNFVGL